MARRDRILKSFLEHEKIKTEYKIAAEDIPSTVKEAVNSEKPIIKTIALIVEKLESSEVNSDMALYKFISHYLNNTIS